ncbi:hypothetical protein [Streptomyces sp. NPDC017988]|uniref:hypothetical protein n=1 Tax=Streptomyces sp. NPDC017988 TaxID=3365025 RepID=UPI0037AF56FC
MVCGSANNQLARPEVEVRLAERGILYVPDYVANAGGAIQAAGELVGATVEQSTRKAERIFDTTLAVLERARADAVLPGAAADRIAEQRITAASAKRKRQVLTQ